MTEPHRPWEVHGTTEYTPEMVEALKTMHLIRGVPVPAILTNVGSDQAEPATPVTVTPPADPEYLRGWRDAMQCIADWADDKMEHAENSATDAEWGNEIAETFSLVSALASQSIRVPERARQAFFTRTPVPAPVVSGDVEAAESEIEELRDRLANSHEVNEGWVAYKGRVRIQERKWEARLAAALGIEPDGRGLLPHLDQLIDSVQPPQHNHIANGIYACCPGCGTEDMGVKGPLTFAPRSVPVDPETTQPAQS